MPAMPTPRRQRESKRVLWAAAIAALLVHGSVLGTVEAFDLSLAGHGFAVKHDVLAAAITEPDLTTTCTGDVLLATSGRMAMCLAPWRTGDVETCRDDAMMAMWMDLSACTPTNDKIATAEVSLLPKREAEKLAAIDPEPLLEEFKQQQEQEKLKPVPPPQPEQPKQAPPPPPPPQRPAQVVEVAQKNSEKEPENARFLAEQNVVAEKQKVARGSVQEPMVAKSKPEELQAKNDPKEASMKELPKEDPGKQPKAPEVPGKLSMRPPGTQDPSEAPQEAREKGSTTGEKGPLVADGFVPRHGSGMIEQERREKGELEKGAQGAGGGSPQVPNLKPTPEALERALGGGSVDHLEDVESGDETALSAKRWIYASFFNRLKRQVAQNWDPATVWRRIDPDGTKNGFKTRVTEVRVSLNPKGELAKIVVTNPSGVAELDEEAVRSFHAAAPFPNPPDGLVNKEGQITFAFSFFFEIGSPRTSWRVIRQ
jgi:TonB family protein